MNDIMQFAAEELDSVSQPSVKPWRVLVVDDDGEVHQATRFALGDKIIFGRPLHLIHAYSAAEAEVLLRQNNEISVILLDVVMESDDSGLNLINLIRQELNHQSLRIILRTGQPGMAPEESLVSHYDVHDYMLKSEVSHARLVTSLTTAVRIYQRLQDVECIEQQLTQVVTATTHQTKQSLASFASYYWQQLVKTYGLNPLLMVSCSCAEPTLANVLAADEAHQAYIGHLVSNLPSDFFTLDDLFDVLLSMDVNQYQNAIVLTRADQRLLVLLKDEDYRQQVSAPSWRLFHLLMQHYFSEIS